MDVIAASDITNIATATGHTEHPVNRPINLFRGTIRLHTSAGSAAGPGRVELRFLPKPEVWFSVGPTKPIGDDDYLTLEIPDRLSSAAAIVSTRRSSRSSRGYRTTITGHLNASSLEYLRDEPSDLNGRVGRVQFNLLNFRSYHGAPIHRSPHLHPSKWNGRAAFELGKWRVTLDALPDLHERLKKARQTNGFAITHVGTLCRRDGKLFGVHQAKSALECLYWFFAFACGRRCDYVLARGLRHLGVPVWEEWGVRTVSPASSCPSWLCTYAAEPSLGAASGFYAAWQDKNRRDWLRLGVALYTASNQNASGIEACLIQAQMALELLSWAALVEDHQIVTPEQFAQPPAFAKFRQLVAWCSLPLAIPESLPNLRAAFPKLDGPEAITETRNCMMHPTKANRAKRHALTQMAVYEAWQLSMLYIELALLKLIGYDGPYNNRLGNAPGHIHQQVPWAL